MQVPSELERNGPLGLSQNGPHYVYKIGDQGVFENRYAQIKAKYPNAPDL